MSSIILNTDSYKTSHFEQYPPLTEKINSYIEARGIDDSFPRVKSTLFFGLQMFIKKYLLTPITKEDIYLTNKYLGQTDQLGLIFDNGDLIVDETFDTIRERAKVV